jgi:lipoyl(octanoyl) transferase
VLSSLTVYEDNVPRSAPLNMALDEVLWQTATTPSLRFYRWDHPALSFGYFGRYEDVARYAGQRDIVRRCTGGGIVFHGTDLTYALIVPSEDLLQLGTPIGVYTFVHTAVQHALLKSGVPAALVASNLRSAGPDAHPDPTSDMPNHRQHRPSSGGLDACFTRPVAADVLLAYKKIAGAAQRRSRRGLLQQGSIQNVALPPGFNVDFVANLSSNVLARTINPASIERAAELAAAKYASEVWLRRT